MLHRLVCLGVVLGSTLAVVGRCPAQLAARGPQPNIILIVADDLGFSDLGCYGGEILTPNLDKMAAKGLRFTQFYNAGRSCPSRAALLTGLYPHEAGVGHMMNDYQRPGYRGNLSRQCATIAQVLQTAGYRSMMCGKWHLSRYTDPGGPKYNWPLGRGFEKFYGTIHGVGSYFNPVTLTRGEHFIAVPQGDYYYTDAISDHAVRYVEWAALSDKPFFLYVAYSAPHWPLHAPAEIVARYQARYAAGWDSLREQRHRRMVTMGIVKPQWPLTDRDPRVRPWEQDANKRWQQRRMEVYAAQIDLMDSGIGRILEKLRQVGAEPNTLVMFLSDNGGCAEEISPTWQGIHIPTRTRTGRAVQKGNNPNILPGPADTYQSYGVAWAQASNTPFRLYKHWMHEGGIATPMIVRWPAAIPSGGRLTHAVGHVIDVMPTCLEVAKIRYPKILAGLTLKPTSGQSLVPMFQGAARPRGPIFWEHEGNRAVRDGKWKLVSRYPGPWELYDMEADRTETNNLGPRFPIIVQDLKRAYESWAKRSNVEQWRK